MKNVKMIASFVLLLCFTKKALSYPGGAPESQCTDMTPQGSHGSGRPHNNSPFEITSSAIPGGYIPGEMYTVTISKKQTSDPDFKGYLCQVRQVGQTATFGTFTPRDTTKSRLLNCIRANDAVTHANRDTVSEQVFEWTPRRLGVGTDVQVVCTVVQQTSTLWVQLTSARFQELEVRSTTSNRATTILPTTKVSSSSSSLIATVRLVSQQPTSTTTTMMSASAGRQDTNLSGSQVSVVPTKQTASSPTTADGTSGAAHASPLILLLVCFLAIIILLL